jgi:hypothetical protein
MTSPAFDAAIPKAPDTPLANSQELRARVVAQRIAPFRRAVLRFIGPQARAATQLPTNREINKLMIDQIPTLVPTPGAFDLGAPEPARKLDPIAAPKALKIS